MFEEITPHPNLRPLKGIGIYTGFHTTTFCNHSAHSFKHAIMCHVPQGVLSAYGIHLIERS